MKYTVEKSIWNFEWWGGAKDTLKMLTAQEQRELNEYLNEWSEENDLTETDINDFVWFEEDWIAKFLGFDNFEQIVDRYFKERRGE